jgi:hypothetical protein
MSDQALIVTLKVRIPYWGTRQDDIDDGYDNPMERLNNFIQDENLFGVIDDDFEIVKAEYE